ncbi:alpha/beta fold hydrolase [Gulosibacter faecalis]|uniref:Alpha/beta fold hydrolase n=1 Tax=Gulosibacter faecalis TaxID=272240 RepID=A0ABW5UUT6_9MICO|nr:alpha/beta hydrolase [Gulosibacter faecalis]
MTAPTCVEFLHAGPQSPRSWDAVIEQLPASIDAVAQTIPGVSAPGREKFSLDIAARWVLDDLADRSDDAGVIVGISVGALIAIRAAALEPGLVKGLVLSAPFARTPKTMLRLQRTIVGALPERAVAGPTRDEGGSGITKQHVLDVLDGMSNLDLRPDLYRIQCPALVLVGGNDRANLRGAGEVVESMKDATLQVVPGEGHLWNESDPTRFAAAVTGWVEQL